MLGPRSHSSGARHACGLPLSSLVKPSIWQDKRRQDGAAKPGRATSRMFAPAQAGREAEKHTKSQNRSACMVVRSFEDISTPPDLTEEEDHHGGATVLTCVRTHTAPSGAWVVLVETTQYRKIQPSILPTRFETLWVPVYSMKLGCLVLPFWMTSENLTPVCSRFLRSTGCDAYNFSEQSISGYLFQVNSGCTFLHTSVQNAQRTFQSAGGSVVLQCRRGRHLSS